MGGPPGGASRLINQRWNSQLASRPTHTAHEGVRNCGKERWGAAGDGRLGEEGRKHRVAESEGRLCEVLLPYPLATTPEMPPHERDFTNLVNELGRLAMAEELFTFVLVPEVEATNNGTERELKPNPSVVLAAASRVIDNAFKAQDEILVEQEMARLRQTVARLKEAKAAADPAPAPRRRAR